MKKIFAYTLEKIAAPENLLGAWKDFIRGKHKSQEVHEFGLRLMDNIFSLRSDLLHRSYCHGPYYAFRISDPKPRHIHKAMVRDRVLHHAVHRVLYPYFDTLFIPDSYSCRAEKGTHRALYRFAEFGRKVSQNNTRTCWVLKCDIKKFFASIDHAALLEILRSRIIDKDVLWLLSEIIESFSSASIGIGLPLGNLTSQLFANIYMNEFDQFIKHCLKVKYYIRYADDFVILSHNKSELEKLLISIDEFLRERLRLHLHPDKVFIKAFVSGVDFLGWVHFPDHRVLRTTTKRRMMQRIAAHPTRGTVNSYLGLLSHGNTDKLKQEVLAFRC